MKTLPSPRRTERNTAFRFFAFCLLLGLAACGNYERRPGFDSLDSSDGGDGGVAVGACDEGATRACGITLDRIDGVVSCFRGTQVCEGGFWGACSDGEITEEPDPESRDTKNFRHVEAVSSPASCVGNPCDPSCQYYNEDPADITPPPVVTTPSNPAVPDWSNGGSSSTCAHELCTVGTKLDATCHPCVESICATQPSCCSTAWTQACADLVYTQCAGTSLPTPGLNLCDFAAFGQTHIRFGNGGTGNPTIGSSADGTQGTPDGSSIYLETNCSVGRIYTEGSVNLRNGCQINGDVIAEGNVWLEAGSTKLTGSLTSGGNVELRNGTIVTGAIQAVGNLTMQSNAAAQSTTWVGGVTFLSNPSLISGNAVGYGNFDGQVNGKINGSATARSGATISTNLTVVGGKFFSGAVTKPPVPDVVPPDVNQYRRNLSASCTVANSRPSFNTAADVTLAPGIYGDYTIHGGKKLILSAGGAYVFRSLRFYASGQMRFAGSPKWDVSTCGNFQTDGNVTFYLNNTTTKPAPQDFIVYSAATSGEGISIGDSNVFDAMMIAPDSQIHVYNNYTGTSAFWGKSVYTEAGMRLTNIPAAACQGTNVFQNVVCDGTTPLYTDGKTYATGDKVFYKGNIYSCLVGGWCTVGAGLGGLTGYWPGEGSAWTMAWQKTGTCPAATNPSTSGGVCPVVTSAPAVPKAQVPCYSGLDCQVNSRCTEVLTGASCSHSKCVTGAALVSGCDSCVERICAADPSCCGTSWTSSCVDKVATLCDASCGTVTTTGCAHDACVTGAALASSCSTDVAAVCATTGFATCCTTAWTQACADKFTQIKTGTSGPSAPAANTSICDYAVMGNGSAAIYSTTIKGNVGWLNGAVSIAEQWSGAGRPNITGSVYNKGSMAISNTDIGGSVVQTGTFAQSGSTVGGTVSAPNGSVPTVSTPTYGYSCPISTGNDVWSASGTLAPGSYKTVQLSGNLTLQAGTYYMQALNNWNGYTITLPASGNVNIFLCTDMQMNSAAKILSPANDPLQLFVYTKGGVINFQDNAIAYGVFTTGHSGGTVTLGQNVKLYGMAHSYWGIFQSSRGSVVDASGISRNACLSRGVDPNASSTVSCPTGTPPLSSSVVASGTCVNNATGYKVSSSVCSGIDLAVGLNCSDTSIPICNHGNTKLTANQAQLVFYPKRGQQFATMSPTSSWEAGRCTITSDIAPGACVDQTCPSTLLDEDLTVRVAMTTASGVTECSALDNWSYFVKGRTCSGSSVGGSLTRTEKYEAKCPADTSPVWGFLTWNSSTPGASKIDFELRSATSEAGLASASYTAIQGAARTPIDTQVCSLAGGPSVCPVNVSKALWGTAGKRSQPRFLELRASLSSSGSDSPTLKDWKLTYSCVYDQ